MIAQANRLSSGKIHELIPTNVDAEISVLGGILIDPNAMGRVADLLTKEHFSIRQHQIIYQACTDLYRQNKSIDLMSVTTHLVNMDLLEAAGGQNKLAQLVDWTVSATNIDQTAMLVYDKYVRRTGINIGYELSGLAQRQDIELKDLVEEFKARIAYFEGLKPSKSGAIRSESEIKFDILCQQLDKIEAIENPAFQDWEMKRLAKEWGFKSNKELLDFHAKFLDSRQHKGTSLFYGLSEYFDKFGDSVSDWILRGWLPNKTVTVLHGPGGMGKTRVVSSICRALITGQKWSGYEVEEPTCVLFVETDQGSVINVKMLDEQGYLEESEEVRSRFKISDDWNINQFGKLKAMLKEIQKSHSESKILVVVDSLTTVSSKSIYSENDQEFARPLVRFRAIAEEFNSAFLVLHHSSRAGECRGTTAIYNAADQVWKLERCNPKDPADTNANLEIQKTRVRAPGRYRLTYDPDNWSWQIVGRVNPDETIDDNYGPAKEGILQYLKTYRGVGFEVEDLAEICQLAPATCRKELAALEREGLINSCKRGRPRKVYFLGELVSSPKKVDPNDPFDPFDPLIQEKIEGEKNNFEFCGSTDQTQLKPIQAEESSVDPRPDQNGSNGSNFTELNKAEITAPSTEVLTQKGLEPDFQSQEDCTEDVNAKNDTLGNSVLQHGSKVTELNKVDKSPSMAKRLVYGNLRPGDRLTRDGNEPSAVVEKVNKTFVWVRRLKDDTQHRLTWKDVEILNYRLLDEKWYAARMKEREEVVPFQPGDRVRSDDDQIYTVLTCTHTHAQISPDGSEANAFLIQVHYLSEVTS